MVLESIGYPLCLSDHDRVSIQYPFWWLHDSRFLSFLIFPSSFKSDASPRISSKSAEIVAIVLLVLGYTLSGTIALVCRSWLFQLDIILIPCLSSCVLGLVNVLYHLSTQSHSPQWTSSAILATTISVISLLTYTVVALLTFRKIYIVRARDAMHRHHGGPSAERVLETEAQIKQWESLLSQREDVKKATQANNQQTFKLEWPGNGDRRSTIGTLRNLPRAARNAYESRANSMYGRQDFITPAATQMDPVAEEASIAPSLGALPATAYVPTNYDDHIVNTRFTTPETPQAPTPNRPQLGPNGYPLEKTPNQNFDVQHPQERAYDQYHIVEEDHRPIVGYGMARLEDHARSVSRGSTRSREDRRLEIELADRGRHNELETPNNLHGVEVIKSIKRVETDGWGRRHG